MSARAPCRRTPPTRGFPPNIKILVFWLLAFGLGVRLVHVGAPPIGMHSWRQADTAAMARNFHENGYRFAFPEVDWGGAGPGYVECELPLFPFTVALAYAADGVHEWIGPRFGSVGGEGRRWPHRERLSARRSSPALA